MRPSTSDLPRPRTLVTSSEAAGRCFSVSSPPAQPYDDEGCIPRTRPTFMKTLRLVQFPVPPPAALAATGNVPLAAGCLGVAARVHGLDREVAIDVVEPEVTDALGDTLLADHIARDEPDFVGFSLYLWNSERSLHLAREVTRRSPRTRVLIGGPEVSPDNGFILRQSGADIAVTGEAEDTFARVMSALV